jgi:putative ABC transport system permease protein
MDKAQWEAVSKVPGIVTACPTTMFPIQTQLGSSLGLKDITPTNTLYVSFDPDAFFKMTSLQWIQGDPVTAREKLAKGKSLLVSREYLVAHNIGVGSKLTLLTPKEGPVEFEVVGVVASAGLDLAVQFFGIQRVYSDAALSSVFGSREDAIRYFGVDAINLVLLSFDPDIPDSKILKSIDERIPGTHSGSARQIRTEVQGAAKDVMSIGSTAALAALFIAAIGVGNLIIANIASRRFEYGVLRSVGAGRFLLARLVAAETVIVALAGSVVGTTLGLQLAWIGQSFHQRILGITYTPELAWDVVGWGSCVVVGMALLAALPAITRLVLTPPRSLIAGDA